MILRISREELVRLSRVTGLSEKKIHEHDLNKSELDLFKCACKFIIKGTRYEETRYRKRNTVC